MTPDSSSENHPSINADEIIDVALHHEIKFRAYELYRLVIKLSPTALTSLLIWSICCGLSCWFPCEAHPKQHRSRSATKMFAFIETSLIS